jgi:hypothetical protein
MNTITHSTDDFHPRGWVRTLCGQTVRAEGRELDLRAPTCPRCIALEAAREAEPVPAWAQEGARR